MNQHWGGKIEIDHIFGVTKKANEKSSPTSDSVVTDPDSIISFCELIEVWMDRSYQSSFVFVTRQISPWRYERLTLIIAMLCFFPPTETWCAQIRFIQKGSRKGVADKDGVWNKLKEAFCSASPAIAAVVIRKARRNLFK